MGETTIGGYEVLGTLGDSKRFRAFRASRRAPEGERRGTLYLMADEVRHPELFIETVDTIRAAWPFPIETERDYVLPKAQLWTGRPWFFLPEMLPVASSGRIMGPAAFASLRAQLHWLEQFHPPGGEPHFAHGDVRKERIALFDAEHPLLIAPGWVAASELARGKSLSHVRGDDAWHLGKLWILESDHSFVPEGMEPEPDEAARRLPRARLPQRSSELGASPAPGARRGNGSARREAPAREAAATPPPGRAAAPKREGSGVTAAPAARPARPARETPPGREAARPAREASPVRQGAREAAAPRERPAARETARERAVATAPAAPARSSAAPAVRQPAAAAPAASLRAPATAAPSVPVAPLRTPAAPAAASDPPLREAPAAARARPARQTPAAQPAYDTAPSPPAHSPSAPPMQAPPEPAAPAPAIESYYPSTPASAELAAPREPPASPLQNAPPAAAPAAKGRGMQIAIAVLVLLVAAVAVALTILKR